jgi:hypothetical protein
MYRKHQKPRFTGQYDVSREDHEAVTGRKLFKRMV